MLSLLHGKFEKAVRFLGTAMNKLFFYVQFAYVMHM